MTNEEKVRLARENLAYKFFEKDVRRFQGPKAGELIERPDFTESWYSQYLQWADEVLELRYPNGNPMFAILDDEQELPRCFIGYHAEVLDRKTLEPIYEQKKFTNNCILLKNGWRKTLEMPWYAPESTRKA